MANTKLARELKRFVGTLPADTKMSAQELVNAYQRYSNGVAVRTVEAKDLEFTPKNIRLVVRAFKRSVSKRVVLYFKKGKHGMRVMTFERMTKCLQTIGHAKRGLRAYYDRGEHLKRRKK